MTHHADVGPILTSSEWMSTTAHIGNTSSATVVVAANNSVEKTKASVIRWDYYTAGAVEANMRAAGTSYWAAQSITIPSTGSRMISIVRFYLKKIGSPVGNLVAKVYDPCTGTPGSTGKPTGTADASSATVAMATAISSTEYAPV